MILILLIFQIFISDLKNKNASSSIQTITYIMIDLHLNHTSDEYKYVCLKYDSWAAYIICRLFLHANYWTFYGKCYDELFIAQAEEMAISYCCHIAFLPLYYATSSLKKYVLLLHRVQSHAQKNTKACFRHSQTSVHAREEKCLRLLI